MLDGGRKLFLKRFHMTLTLEELTPLLSSQICHYQLLPYLTVGKGVPLQGWHQEALREGQRIRYYRILKTSVCRLNTGLTLYPRLECARVTQHILV